MLFDDFFLKGFEVFSEPGIELKPDMAKYIAEKYIKPVFPSWKLIELVYSEKVLPEDRITVWHNDSKFGMNITFLYYVDNMDQSKGGSISISNGNEEIIIYPKYGTLVMMSQKINMMHKVGYTTHQRRMYNIDYYVEGY